MTVTGGEKARRRWKFPVTRPGIEGGPNVTERRSVTGFPTEGADVARPAATFDCNECNEALRTARAVMAMTRRLALAAADALLNGDLRRARLALVELQEANARGAQRHQAVRESR